MSETLSFKLTGIALPTNPVRILDEMCEHFVEHAEVSRTADLALMTSKYGTARIRLSDDTLFIELACPTEHALQVSRSSIAEHMFYFAGQERLELTWSKPETRTVVPNLREAVVVGAENVTPLMRRVKFSCADVGPYVGGEMHVRILIPPKGRKPSWPGYRPDGRLDWPTGEDKLIARAYTIRAVDVARQELWVDFFQHSHEGVATPGGDFARDAMPGDVVALIGPGSGGVPSARSIVMVGDESALPAIARIVAEVPRGTEIKALIEVENAEEEQPLPTAGNLHVRWLHRERYPAGSTGTIAEEAKANLASIDSDTFVWVACEKQDVRSIKSFLKKRGHDKNLMYVAWYWDK